MSSITSVNPKKVFVFVFLCNPYFKTDGTMQPKPSLKIRVANGIFWISLGMLRDYGLKNIFFRNKTFLFFKIES